MMIRTVGLAAVLAVPLAAPTVSAAAAAPLAFQGVELGTTEAAWRALKIPAPNSAHAQRACSDDKAGAAAGLTADGLPKGAVLCGVVDIYGRYRLPVSFSWRRQYPVDHLRFVFRRSRLSEIRAMLPEDAFDALMADFKRSYGAPSHTTRDRVRTAMGKLPRVIQTWTLPQGRIELVDPAASGKLSVRLTSPAAGAS